jgi:hypothetical protein
VATPSFWRVRRSSHRVVSLTIQDSRAAFDRSRIHALLVTACRPGQRIHDARRARSEPQCAAIRVRPAMIAR